MAKELIHQKKVTGAKAGQFTVTEDGGMARNYTSLTEVLIKNGRFEDCHYFVSSSNADAFVSELKQPIPQEG